MLARKRFFPFREDFREPFSRDRDRVIHSSSFRRLEYKTQVFINHEGDYFRTRLTHSLEVAQIARTIAKTLALEESLAEAIALSHDLGHTPFGHVGGDELDRLLKEDGFVNGFEHNFQSFRVVTKLEKRYKDFDGLNLTYATLEGILKHSYPYQKPFFPKEIVEEFKLDFHPSFEAMIVDFADEIAYISADIDDGIKYKLISYEDIKEQKLIQRAMKFVEQEGITKDDKIFRYRLVAHLITILVQNLTKNSQEFIQANKKDMPLCSYFKASEKLPIGFSKEIATELKGLKKRLFDRLYFHEAITKKMYAGKQCVKGLYEAYKSDERLLPREYRALLEQRPLHRVVSDYIASMTDRYAFKSYRELYGIFN